MRTPYSAALVILMFTSTLTANQSAVQSEAPSSASKPAAAPAQPPAGARSSAAIPAAAPTPSPFKDDTAKTSYALGMNFGISFHKEGVGIDPQLVLQGLQDGLAGGKFKMTEDEMAATLRQLQGTIRAKQEERRKLLPDANRKEGDAFLAANKTRDGVVTLPSGLQYKIITAGTGPKPGPTDTVVCNYRGTLIDGTEFDSSAKHGGPASFALNQVIKGWTEALQLMPVGSKWQLVIPPDLGYGERGASEAIGPNATLIFEIELVSVRGKW